MNRPQTREPGVTRGLPHLGDNGKGVNRPQTREPGVTRDRPHLANDGGGVNRPQTREPGVLSDDSGNEFHPMTMPELVRWFQWLSARLRHVRILNGDWGRLVTRGASHTLAVRMGDGHCGYFLDPPYAAGERSATLYTHETVGDTIPAAVNAWCVANGDNPTNRIILAGYDTEHTNLVAHGWTEHEWFKTGFLKGGMGNISQGDGETHQQHRERLWASPHCLDITPEPAPQQTLWENSL